MRRVWAACGARGRPAARVGGGRRDIGAVCRSAGGFYVDWRRLVLMAVGGARRVWAAGGVTLVPPRRDATGVAPAGHSRRNCRE